MAATASTRVEVYLPTYYTDADKNDVMLPGQQEIVNEFTQYAEGGDVLVVGSYAFYQNEIVGIGAVKMYLFFVADLPTFLTAYNTYIASLNLSTDTFNVINTQSVELGS